jgi:Zn-dependent M28 family amino/carboxypeptidase
MVKTAAAISSSAFVVLLSLVGFSLSSCSANLDPEQIGMNTITADNLLEHIKVISDDSLEGRQTGSRGEQVAGEYIAAQLAENGVLPGGTGGSWYQDFSLLQKTPRPADRFETTAGGTTNRPVFGRDFVASTIGAEAEVNVRGGLVFTGYSIKAPEYGWDDYGEVDLSGKVLLSMWSEPESDDSTFFEGQTQSEYAGAAHKRRMAEEKGAAGILFVYDPEKIPYPWAAFSGFFAAPQMIVAPDPAEDNSLMLQGVITTELARELFALSGRDFDAEANRAETAEFSPVDLDAELNARLRTDLQTTPVRNVVGYIPGVKENEYVLYTAHTDHLGIGAPDSTGDSIINGAIDDASGCAALIEVGRAFANLPSPPQRSILLLAVTAEEKGLLGSRYYTEHPIYPLEETLAVINFDGVLPWGNSLDIGFFGYERSTLGELLGTIAAERGMTLGVDPMPEQNFYMRSDHYSFAQHGVPGGMLMNGLTFEDKPEGWGLEKLQRWLGETYHHPSEEYSDDWDMRPVEMVVRVGFQLGYRLTTEEVWPEWYEGQPYKRIREEALGR